MADSRQRGYECKFVESVKDHHQCPICLLPIREPQHIIECGHIFCKSCIEGWIRTCSASVAKCPVDNRTLIQGRTFYDQRVDREIKSLKVYCQNYASGCNEQMELGEYEEHCSTCPYKMVDCPLNCSLKLMNRLISKHVEFDCARRIVQCELCELPMEYQLKQEHLLHCPLRLVSCDLCKHVLIYQELKEHKEVTCPNVKTQCLFAPLGCSEEIERKFLQSHHEASTQQHLSQLTLAALKLYSEGDSVPEKEASVTYELPVSLVAKFAKKPQGAAIQRSVSESADPHLGHSMMALKQSIESLKNDNKKLRREVIVATEDNGAMKAEIVELKEKMNELMQEIEVMRDADDTESVTSEVPTFEPSPVASGAAISLFCPYTWRVDMAKCMGLETFFSHSFHSWQGGYKFGMSLKYSGLKGGKHKWFFRCFLKKGDHDNKLPWPFTGIVNFHVERMDTKKVLSNYTCNHNSNEGRTINRRNKPLFYRYVEVPLKDMASQMLVLATLKLA